MKIPTFSAALPRLASALLLALAASWSAPARAEITLVDTKDWNASIDGRFNAFITYAYGKNKPLDTGNLTPTPGSGLEEAKDNKNAVETTRVHSGFVASVLGVNLKRRVTENTTIRAL